jgi:hypothetical protein
LLPWAAALDSHQLGFLLSHLTYGLLQCSQYGLQLAVAATLHVVLALRSQGGEIALAAVIDNDDDPM